MTLSGLSRKIEDKQISERSDVLCGSGDMVLEAVVIATARLLQGNI